MSESPDSKKLKLDMKRPNESATSPTKRSRKADENYQESLQNKIISLKRKNFIKACEIVSYNAYYNTANRFLLVNIPSCLGNSSCKHRNPGTGVALPIPGYAEESFKIEMKTNMWNEALEVCQMCITSHQYLTADVLKDIVEIMMNAHEDEDADWTIKDLIRRCQQTLSQNFTSHPPCLLKSVRKCYNNFLTSPMDLKDKSLTNRTEFGCELGIVKYCMNRLEHELGFESKDEPLFDKFENIPSEMKQSVKGLHWQKEKFEIFELLDRTERIKRLMAVLESVIELLQFDLAIWHSRHTTNQGRHIMRSHKPIMAYVLWSDKVLYTGAVNNNCRQILRLFALFVHLGYPKHYIHIMCTWLNTMIQTFYICETNSNADYPNIGKYSTAFAREFYKVISEFPNNSILKILEEIKPAFMQHLIVMLHLKSFLAVEENSILKIFIEFVNKSMWEEFPSSKENLLLPNNRIKAVKCSRLITFMTKKCQEFPLKTIEYIYPKFDPIECASKFKIRQNYVVKILHLTLKAYFEAYNIIEIQNKVERLNKETDETQEEVIIERPLEYSYSASEHFIKNYRNIYQTLKELLIIFQKIKHEKHIPEILKVFNSLGIGL